MAMTFIKSLKILGIFAKNLFFFPIILTFPSPPLTLSFSLLHPNTFQIFHLLCNKTIFFFFLSHRIFLNKDKQKFKLTVQFISKINRNVRNFQ